MSTGDKTSADDAPVIQQWSWSQLVNVSWRKKKFELELLEQQVVSPNKPYMDGEEGADFEEVTEVILQTKHNSHPKQMLEMVQFQHQRSIDVLKLIRKQRRIECACYCHHFAVPACHLPPAHTRPYYPSRLLI